MHLILLYPNAQDGVYFGYTEKQKSSQNSEERLCVVPPLQSPTSPTPSDTQQNVPNGLSSQRATATALRRVAAKLDACAQLSEAGS